MEYRHWTSSCLVLIDKVILKKELDRSDWNRQLDKAILKKVVDRVIAIKRGTERSIRNVYQWQTGWNADKWKKRKRTIRMISYRFGSWWKN